MKKSILALALGVLLTMPYALHAEEVEIQLFEVVSMTPLPGYNPLDGPSQSGDNPTDHTQFRAIINGNYLSVTKLTNSIPSAQATVVNASTGNIIINSVFTESLQDQIPNTGIYVLNIQTANGALTGHFLVQ